MNDENFNYKDMMQLYQKIKPSQSELSEFCNNEAFGYFFGRENDSNQNRKILAQKILAYIRATQV